MTTDTETAQVLTESWNHLPKGSVYNRQQFEDWTLPLTRKGVQGKTVLELGCGNYCVECELFDRTPMTT